jgi:hypothetical protein
LIRRFSASGPAVVRGSVTMLRAPSARGPSLLPPWNQPMICPSAIIWVAVAAMSLSRPDRYGVRWRSTRPECGSRVRACSISVSVYVRPK